MKNLDIENLERKRPILPDDFFSEMQANVLRETIYKKKSPVFSINWGYAAAAAFALIFGLSIFLTANKNDKQDTALVTNTAVKNVSQENTKNVTPESKPGVSEEKYAYVVLTKDLTSVEKNNPIKAESKKTTPAFAKNEKTKADAEVEMEKMLANFSEDEIAKASANIEQDVYLDLYN